MNEELYAEDISYGVLEIDTNKFFSRVGQVISVRLVTDPRTGQQKWLTIAEMASKVNAGQAYGVQRVKQLAGCLFELTQRNYVLFKRIVLVVGALLVLGGSFGQVTMQPADETAAQSEALIDTEIDMEIRRVMEKGINLEERRRQIPAIVAAFSRRTDAERARRLAALCYLKTLGTPFMPLDIAVIALAETGPFGLSGEAVSPKGALGVWQVMPERAVSHGYTPREMKNDEKCAEAAVRELSVKLKVAKGNMAKAKKLYCGWGPAADAYLVKIKKLKKEIMDDIARLDGGMDLSRAVKTMGT